MTALAVALTPRAAIPDHAAVLEALPVPVLLLDPAGKIRVANAAAEDFFAMSAGQLRQKRLLALLPPEHPIGGLIEQVRNGASVISHDLALGSPRMPRRDTVTVTGTPVADHPGCVLLTFQDGAGFRAIDRHLTFRNAARSVSGMAAVLAHEVKNPLSGIRGAAQLLEASAAAGDQELCVLIREEADRIRELVDRMEQFGERPVERAPVNIHRVLERVRRIAHTGFAAHLRITESYDPSLPAVWGNRDQLTQVLLNLIKNAAEAITDAGQDGEITLLTAFQTGMRLAVAGGAARELPLLVTVRDDGPGIADAVRENLFDPFVSGKAAGSGLGLALVAKIVGDHGGLIEVDSEPGRTEFRLHLPMAHEPDDDGVTGQAGGARTR